MKNLNAALDLVLPAPDPDHHVHRDQAELAEQIEEEQIERDERPDHRAFKKKKREAQFFERVVTEPNETYVAT